MKRRILLFLGGALFLPAPFPLSAAANGDPRTEARANTGTVLTLSQALQLAEAHNRQIENGVLGVSIAEDKTAQARALRWPQLKVSGLGGYLLSPLEFHFQKGAFGSYSGVGPIPGTDTVIETPRQFTLSGVAQLTQPLSQQYKVNLLVQGAKVAREADREKLRAQRHLVRMQVKQSYFALVQAGAGLRAAEENLRFAVEAQRLMKEHLAERTVLPADLLEVEAMRSEAEAGRRQCEDTLGTQREQLNLLLGRSLETAFEVEPIAPPDEFEADLAEARAKAMANRPEIRLAHLGTQGAELNRRVARAAYIPELSLALSHVRTSNSEVLPSTISTAGLLLQWDLYEGGRKRRELALSNKSLQQARNTETDTEAQLMIEVGAKLGKVRQARLLWRAAQLHLEAEEARLRDATAALGEKAILQRDLLRQSATTQAAASRYQQALQGFWSARTEFEHALGLD